MATGSLGKKYTADFETTTNPDDLRVWAWGLNNIESENFCYNNDMDSFINYLKYKIEDSSVLYFHNLKFDGEFLFYWLFENGYEWTGSRKLYKNQFSTLISNMGVFYSIKIKFDDGKTVTILDSVKLLPFKVKDIPKYFNLPILKGDIDYHKERVVGYNLDDEEVKYLKHDVAIPSKALRYFFDQGLDKMTVASNALSDYKKIVTPKKFKRWFPYLEEDKIFRKAYKGGVTQVNPKFQNMDIGEGVTLDVNSLYPYVMNSCKLPYGEPIYQKGKVEHDKFYNVSIQRLVCNFKIKKNHLPTIQIKKNFRFKDTEYLRSSNGVDVVLTLTSVDLEIFMKHYDVTNITYIEGWKFRSTDKMFKEYIAKWIKVKNDATINGNYGLRTLAKLMLNSLYGKFGLNPLVQSKIPYFTKDGIVKYKLGEQESRPPIYVPVACFITSYARQITIDAGQQNYDRFLYMDTDSIHLIGTEIPDNIWVDQIELGAWKVEGTFTRARFLRAKSYVEEVDGVLDIKCAGLPDQCKQNITYDNFKKGLVVHGKLQQKRAKGGVYLKEIDFTIDI